MNQIQPNGGSITIIHFIYPLDDTMSEHRIACMPRMTEFHKTHYHPNYQRTNDPRAATCPACKRTEVFTEAMQRNK